MPDPLSRQQMDFLTRFIGVTIPDRGASGGLVKKRSFLITRWQQIKTDLDTELATLSTAIATHVPFENPGEIRAGVTAALAPFLDDLRSELQDAVDTAVNAGDPDYTAVRNAVQSCQDKVKANQVIATLRSSSLMSGPGFERAIDNALTEIRDKLTA